MLLHVVVAVGDASRDSAGIAVGAVEAVARLAALDTRRVVATPGAVGALNQLCGGGGGVSGRGGQSEGDNNLFRNV